MSSAGEAACSYAALILYDDGIPITAEKIATLVKAANVSVESYWPSLFAKLFEKCNIEDLITNVGAAGAGAAVAAAAPVAAGAGGGAAAPPPAEEKKKSQRKRAMMIWDSVYLIRSSFQCMNWLITGSLQ
uniref:Uncharacterized protein n=3 Tax=Gossypium TaxID=3633 RepID=A0A0D2QQU5_GOSRA|nr:hypothetical protein B456_007G112800 [Gossypium raimondii]